MFKTLLSLAFIVMGILNLVTPVPKGNRKSITVLDLSGRNMGGGADTYHALRKGLVRATGVIFILDGILRLLKSS